MQGKWHAKLGSQGEPPGFLGEMGCERGICLGTSSYLAAQKGEESAGVGCVCALSAREGTGMKQGWQGVCMQGPWDCERKVPVQSLLYLGSRD